MCLINNEYRKKIIKSLERKLKKNRKDFMCNYGIQKVLFRYAICKWISWGKCVKLMSEIFT
jgi:hypothetical protein